MRLSKKNLNQPPCCITRFTQLQPCSFCQFDITPFSRLTMPFIHIYVVSTYITAFSWQRYAIPAFIVAGGLLVLGSHWKTHVPEVCELWKIISTPFSSPSLCLKDVSSLVLCWSVYYRYSQSCRIILKCRRDSCIQRSALRAQITLKCVSVACLLCKEVLP